MKSLVSAAAGVAVLIAATDTYQLQLLFLWHILDQLLLQAGSELNLKLCLHSVRRFHIGEQVGCLFCTAVNTSPPPALLWGTRPRDPGQANESLSE